MSKSGNRIDCARKVDMIILAGVTDFMNIHTFKKRSNTLQSSTSHREANADILFNIH